MSVYLAVKTESEYWDSVAEKVLGYDEALKTNTLSMNQPKIRYIIKRLLEHDFHNKRILEVGHGLGMAAATMKLLYMSFFKYKGTDTSPKFAKAAREIFGLTTCVAKANALPFETEQFEVLWLLDILEHIHPKEKVESYTELSRVLAHGGLVFINNPLSETLHDLDFDHGFDQKDLADFCKVLGAKIFSFDVWTATDKSGGEHAYEWIVLVKE